MGMNQEDEIWVISSHGLDMDCHRQKKKCHKQNQFGKFVTQQDGLPVMLDTPNLQHIFGCLSSICLQVW